MLAAGSLGDGIGSLGRLKTESSVDFPVVKEGFVNPEVSAVGAKLTEVGEGVLGA